MALGGLDVALWDLAGQIADRPVHALLGGKLRDRIQAYVSGPFMKPGNNPYRDFEADIAGYLERGFRAIKLRMGSTPAQDGAMAHKVRAQIGDAMPLMVDLNEGFSVEGGMAIARRLAEVDPVWLEEPIAHDDLPGYRRFAAQAADAAGRAARPCSACAPSGIISPPASSISSSPILGSAAGFPRACGSRRCARPSTSRWCPMSGVRSSTSRRRYISPPACRSGAGGCAGRCSSMIHPRTRYAPPSPAIRLTATAWWPVPDAPGLGIDLKIERLEPFIAKHWTIE